MATSKSLNVNGQAVSISIDDPEMPLLYALRDTLALHGPRFGCGLAQCGSCTVHVDGKAVRSCVLPLSKISAEQKIVTLEGLGTPENPHPVQAAFLAEQAAQCGYCTSGIMISAKVLLDRNPDPDTDAIRVALQDNLCRCGTHSRVFRAVRRAARALAR
jgi:nicotinate dehydrogenase subunit A